MWRRRFSGSLRNDGESGLRSSYCVRQFVRPSMKRVMELYAGRDPILLNPATVVAVEEGKNCKKPIGSDKVPGINGSAAGTFVEGARVGYEEWPESTAINIILVQDSE
jgi:hypothetical protein